MKKAQERDTDQELVKRAQSGDKRAFELLVIKYQQRIARLVARLVQDPAEVEDVTQEAFIKAYRALPGFRGESAFYTWIYRIALNSAKNYLAARGRRPQVVQEIEDEEGDSVNGPQNLPDFHTPESELLNREIVSTVNDVVESLPEDLRMAITLREMEGLSYDEIAQLMGCPIGTVRSRIFRARDAIAGRLRPLLDHVGKDKRW